MRTVGSGALVNLATYLFPKRVFRGYRQLFAVSGGSFLGPGEQIFQRSGLLFVEQPGFGKGVFQPAAAKIIAAALDQHSIKIDAGRLFQERDVFTN